MNANIKLSKLITHSASFTGADGRQVNILIIPIKLNNLEHISENKVNLHFVCFERTSESFGNDTHILKQAFTDEQLKTITKDRAENAPILGNLIDWEKHKDQKLPKTVVSGHINLRSLESIIRPYRMKNGQLTDCIVIDKSKNFAYNHDDGSLSIGLVFWKIKNPKAETTHTIKLSAPKEIREAMDADELNLIPFLGSAVRKQLTTHANNDANLAAAAAINTESFDQLNDFYPQDMSDDLPF